MSKGKGFGKFLVGAGIGAGLGMLFAPKKGSQLRKELKVKIDDLMLQLKEVDLDDVKEDIINKIEEIKLEIDELDKEKVLKIAKEKSKELQKKAEELLDLAKAKGTPILEEMASEVKEKTIDVVKEVLKRLEEPKKEEK